MPKIVKLEGDSFEIGYQHGTALRDEIDSVITRWHAHLESLSSRPAHESIDRFLQATDHVNVARIYTPKLVDEVMGIAAGAGRSASEMLAFNLMDEEWRFNELQGLGCSVASYKKPDGTQVLGQNMDLPSWMSGSQALLKIRDNDSQTSQVVITAAGLIGLFGINTSQGTGLCVNALSEFKYNPKGMPVAFIIRGLLSQKTRAESRRFLQVVPHASGQHYALADADGVYGFECSDQGIAESPDGNTLLHTNHILWHAIKKDTGAESEYTHHGSRTRLASLKTALPQLQSGGESLAQTLSNVESGVCVLPHSRKTETFASGVFELGTHQRIHVSMGRPNETPWHEIEI